LRAVGNIATGSEQHAQAVLDAGFMQHATRLLTDVKRNVRKESCWTLSNITAGVDEQKLAVINTPSVAAALLERAGDAAEVKKEAAFVLANMFDHSSVHVIREAAAGGFLHVLVAFALNATLTTATICEDGLNSVADHLDANSALAKSVSQTFSVAAVCCFQGMVLGNEAHSMGFGRVTRILQRHVATAGKQRAELCNEACVDAFIGALRVQLSSGGGMPAVSGLTEAEETEEASPAGKLKCNDAASTKMAATHIGHHDDVTAKPSKSNAPAARCIPAVPAMMHGGGSDLGITAHEAMPDNVSDSGSGSASDSDDEVPP
jgi:hypothetical protein